MGWKRVVVGMGLLGAGCLRAQTASHEELWNAPQEPFKIYGNTYYVGPHGLSSVLITSPQGDVLIDGALPQSAAAIASHVRALGFRMEEIKLILSSHVHRDHAGGIAELQRMSGAVVVGSAWNIKVLNKTGVGRDDPQFGELRPVALVKATKVVRDGESITVGPIVVTAHLTPGHTPGGTSWTWRSCEGSKCLNMVYADSVSAVSAAKYKYSQHPELILGFAKSFAFLEETPCDVLITAHPEASDLWGRMAKGSAVSPGGCKQLAEEGKAGLKQRLAQEVK